MKCQAIEDGKTCGAEISPSAKFCPECGNDVVAVEDRDVPSKPCPRCSAQVTMKQKFCTNCRWKVDRSIFEDNGSKSTDVNKESPDNTLVQLMRDNGTDTSTSVSLNRSRSPDLWKPPDSLTSISESSENDSKSSSAFEIRKKEEESKRHDDQEKRQKGQEVGQINQEEEQNGQDVGQIDKDNEEKGQDMGQRDQEREQKGQEVGQKDQEEEHKGQEDGPVGQEVEEQAGQRTGQVGDRMETERGEQDKESEGKQSVKDKRNGDFKIEQCKDAGSSIRSETMEGQSRKAGDKMGDNQDKTTIQPFPISQDAGPSICAKTTGEQSRIGGGQTEDINETLIHPLQVSKDAGPSIRSETMEGQSRKAGDKMGDNQDKTPIQSFPISQDAGPSICAKTTGEQSRIGGGQTEDINETLIHPLQVSKDAGPSIRSETMEGQSLKAGDKMEDNQDKTPIQPFPISQDAGPSICTQTMVEQNCTAVDKTENIQDKTSIQPLPISQEEEQSRITGDKTEDISDKTSIQPLLIYQDAGSSIRSETMEGQSRKAGDKMGDNQDKTPIQPFPISQDAGPSICTQTMVEQNCIAVDKTEDIQDKTSIQPLPISKDNGPSICTQISEEEQSRITGDKTEDIPDKTQIQPLPIYQDCQKNDQEKVRTATIQELVKFFSLGKYFPEKITLQEVRAMQSNNVSLTKENLPWLLLMKLIMVNINAREEDLVELADQCDDENIEINPMDLFLITFLSCDTILQQEIIQKMLKCRHAIPFIWRDLNSTLRWSKLSMKKILVPEHTSTGINTIDALHHKGKIVAFVKVGGLSVSKSKLLNIVLSENSYSTFFNRECPLGSTDRLIASGTIEASWYFPKDNSSGLFNETIMFLNLRGDAMEHSDEFSKLLKISNVVVVLTNEHSMNKSKLHEKLNAISKDGLLMYALETNLKKRQFDENIKKKLSTQRRLFCSLGSSTNTRSISDVAKEFRKILTEAVQTRQGIRLIDNLHVLEEGSTLCFNTVENLAKEFKTVLDKYPKSERNEFVPAQGKLWNVYSLAYKALYKSKSIEKKRQFEEEIVKIRSQQLQMLKDGIHPLMKLFCSHIEELCQMPQTEFSIYIEWIMSYIDERSREILPERVKNYNTCWKAMKLAKEKQGYNENEVLGKQLLKSEDDLIAASFGLEHLLRELGQMFEATKPIEANNVFQRTVFAEFACKLLRYGYPFELMDGDTAMVPLTWIKAVLQRLVKDIGDKKVLAISVLGIQSSGKSTLLNCMFGLKFPVSAGRCTRGVYIQLVKVENKNLPFSYILVIDTEGLRAPELEHQTHSHDNELATFVIGLGNITIINIKGENTSELEDILQIAVHAFLRLKMANKQLDMNHTCIFTHQNVSASNAMEANAHGRQKMIDKLDKITSEAANQEGLVDITTFNQVLGLDPDSHVFYFSDLFMGDPPMAPVNIGYSKKVEEVRKRLIYEIAVKKRLFLTVSETITRIEDFWKGVLTEDFVFSFRNSLEVKAYNLMETEYFKLTSSIDNVIYRFIREDVRNKLTSCESDEQLDKKANETKLELFKLMAKRQEEAVKNWKDFIDNCSLREIMEQWRENRHNKLMEHKIYLQAEVKRSIDEIKQECSAYLVRKNGNKIHEKEIKHKAMGLAKKHKGNEQSAAILDEVFEEMWDEWLANLKEETPGREVSVLNEVNNVLFERFGSDTQFVLQEQEESNKRFPEKFFSQMKQLVGSFSEDNITEDDIKLVPFSKNAIKKFLKKYIWDWSSAKEDIKKHAVSEIDVMFKTMDTFILEIQKADGIRFNRSYATHIFDQLTEFISEYNNEHVNTRHLTITKKLKVKLAVFIARYITKVFTRFDNDYKRNNSIEAHMSTYKITIKQQFLGIVKEESEIVTLTKTLKHNLEKICIKKFKKQLPFLVIEIIKGERIVTKHNLVLDIMRDLAEQDDFQQYITFIKKPKEFAIAWISLLAENELLSEKEGKQSRYSILLEDTADSYKENILRVIEHASSTTRRTMGDIKSWKETFQNELSETFEVPPDTFDFVDDYKTIKDYMSVSSNLRIQLNSIKRSLNKDFGIEDGRFKPWNENPFFLLIGKVWGCEEKCPFCGEICQRTEINHKETHRCIQHRPNAVDGVRLKATEVMYLTTCHESVSSDGTFSHRFCERASKCSCKDKDKQTETETHLFKKYAEYFPDWDIEPHSGIDASTYWKWFLYRFRDELVKHYDYVIDESIGTWKDITKDDAISSLRC